MKPVFSRILPAFYKLRRLLSTPLGKAAVVGSLGAGSLIALTFVSLSRFSALAEAFEEIDTLRVQAYSASINAKLAREFREKYGDANPHYIEEHLEKKPLLQQERVKLQAIVDSGVLEGNNDVLDRLQFLESSGNTLRFQEKMLSDTKMGSESLLTAISEVQVSEEDIEDILDAIEAPHPGKPQCIIQRWSMHSSGGHFVLSVNILKRAWCTL